MSEMLMATAIGAFPEATWLQSQGVITTEDGAALMLLKQGAAWHDACRCGDSDSKARGISGTKHVAADRSALKYLRIGFILVDEIAA